MEFKRLIEVELRNFLYFVEIHFSLWLPPVEIDGARGDPRCPERSRLLRRSPHGDGAAVDAGHFVGETEHLHEVLRS